MIFLCTSIQDNYYFGLFISMCTQYINCNMYQLLFVWCVAEAFDNELMYKTLKDIVEGRVVEVPTYDFVTHSRYEGFILDEDLS